MILYDKVTVEQIVNLNLLNSIWYVKYAKYLDRQCNL